MTLRTANKDLLLALSPLLDRSLNISTLFTTAEGQAKLLKAYSSTSGKIKRICTEMAGDTSSAAYHETLNKLIPIYDGDEAEAKAFLAGLDKNPFPPAPPTQWDADTVAKSVALYPLRNLSTAALKYRGELWGGAA